MTGKCKWFDEKKGYGFLAGHDGTDVFVHCTGIVGEEFTVLAEGDSVKYDIMETKKGLQAKNVLRTSLVAEDREE